MNEITLSRNNFPSFGFTMLSLISNRTYKSIIISFASHKWNRNNDLLINRFAFSEAVSTIAMPQQLNLLQFFSSFLQN